MKNKTLAAWLAFVGGPLGLHRFYLHGPADLLGWLLPVPFYFMELLVGIVQALVFMLLTAVFTMLICVHEESPGGTGH